jgi:hypothetical protein
MDTIELKKRREELEVYFNKLYKQDVEEVGDVAKRYSEGDKEKFDAFVAGYKHAFKQPHSRTIRLIVMYTLDYIPYYRKVPTIKNIATSIRDIFRKRLYPEGLLDSSKGTNDVREDTSREAGETAEEES